MLEKSNVNEKLLVSELSSSYGISAANLIFLPLGNSTHAWMYEVVADIGTKYFLKLKKGKVFEPSLSVPHFLSSKRFSQIVAPVPNIEGGLSSEVAGFELILYPYITTDTAVKVPMTDKQYAELGKIVKKIHLIHISELPKSIPTETFAKKWTEWISDLRTKVSGNSDGTLQTEMASLWSNKSEVIGEMVRRAIKLSETIEARSHELVLCHTDIHSDNILVKESEIFIVDWDSPMLAPKERDLMFFIGKDSEKAFFKGYGKTAINKQIMAYYLYEWAIQDLCDYSERVLAKEDSGLATKQAAIKSFGELFMPGNAVDKANKYFASL